MKPQLKNNRIRKLPVAYSVLVFTGLLVLLFGCETNRLSNESLDWQPYKVGDMLVFSSSSNFADTVYIDEISSVSHATGGEYFKNVGKSSETVFVSGQIALDKPRKQAGKLYYRKHVDFLRLDATTNGHGILILDYLGRNSHNLKNRYLKLDSLSNIPLTGHDRFNDVVLVTNEYRDFVDEENVILKAFWSKKYGYVGYEFVDGKYWVLSEFIRNGQNLIGN